MKKLVTYSTKSQSEQTSRFLLNIHKDPLLKLFLRTGLVLVEMAGPEPVQPGFKSIKHSCRSESPFGPSAPLLISNRYQHIRMGKLELSCQYNSSFRKGMGNKGWSWLFRPAVGGQLRVAVGWISSSCQGADLC